MAQGAKKKALGVFFTCVKKDVRHEEFFNNIKKDEYLVLEGAFF